MVSSFLEIQWLLSIQFSTKNSWNGAFFNYVDKILSFFEHLPNHGWHLWRNSVTVDINISSIVEFWRWWVLKSKIFGQKSIHSKGTIVFWDYGKHQFVKNWAWFLENKVVQKLKVEKNVFYKKWSPKLLFWNEFLTYKIDFESTILALFDKP